MPCKVAEDDDDGGDGVDVDVGDPMVKSMFVAERMLVACKEVRLNREGKMWSRDGVRSCGQSSENVVTLLLL